MSAPESGLAAYCRAHVFRRTNARPAGHVRSRCRAKGAMKPRSDIKARAKARALAEVRSNTSGCFDRCEPGPTMVIDPEGVWYSYASRDNIDEILERHLVHGGRGARLMLRPGDGDPPR